MLACGSGLLLFGMGCVESHRKGGAYDRAARKDIEEQYLPGDGAFEDDEIKECVPPREAFLECNAGPCKWVCR